VGLLVLVATLPAQVGGVFNAAYQAAQSNYTGDAKTDSLSDTLLRSPLAASQRLLDPLASPLGLPPWASLADLDRRVL
jgi:hypothetical protein